MDLGYAFQLAKLCVGDVTRWDEFQPQASFALSIRRHDATGFSPFFLCHGFEARLPVVLIWNRPWLLYDVSPTLDPVAADAYSAQVLETLDVVTNTQGYYMPE